MERTKHLNQDSRHETVSESNNDGSLCKEKTSCMKRATKLEYGAAVSAGVSVGGNSFLVLFRQFLVNLSLISFSLVEATVFFPFIHMFLTHFSHRGEKTVKPKFTFERKKKHFFCSLIFLFSCLWYQVCFHVSCADTITSLSCWKVVGVLVQYSWIGLQLLIS